MRKCPSPVWLIKATQANRVNKILAAVDLSMEQHAEGRAQNRMIIDIASSLSQFKKAQLTVFHVGCYMENKQLATVPLLGFHLKK